MVFSKKAQTKLIQDLNHVASRPNFNKLGACLKKLELLFQVRRGKIGQQRTSKSNFQTRPK
ncbi:hypothetical protein BSQ39_10205 [Loigolactobacillus backii]|nr:hypothetical protein BSQ39_10205 [Loigolactobacillus backii]